MKPTEKEYDLSESKMATEETECRRVEAFEAVKAISKFLLNESDCDSIAAIYTKHLTSEEVVIVESISGNCSDVFRNGDFVREVSPSDI